MATLMYSEESNFEYFAPMALKRSSSQHQLAGAESNYGPSTPALSTTSTYSSSSKTFPDSPSSSAASSPRTIHAETSDLSYSSTPATNFSIASDYEETLPVDGTQEDDQPPFPLNFQQKFFVHPELQPDDNLEPPPSPKTGDSYTVSPAEHDSSDCTSKPSTPDCVEHAEDDTAVTNKPSRQVDYLSHNWKEEELWSSWSYIVTRRNEVGNSARLENASWRTWAKVRNDLPTISPETLNWLKDCDVTWLYGPLQSGPSRSHPTYTEPSSNTLSKTDSFTNLTKKPILKKRSMSEVMLQRSLSSASLLKQAAAAVQAQEFKGLKRPNFGRSNTDYVTFPFSTKGFGSHKSSSVTDSTDSSGATSPGCGRKHIHFNEQVEQCIALDIKGDDDDEMESDLFGDESDSDDGFMMKRMRTKRRVSLRRKVTRRPTQPEGKTIAMLPSTTLKYREDTPEPQETAMKHSTGTLRSPLMSPSSSQETLRPSRPSAGFYFGEEEDIDFSSDGFFGPSSAWATTNQNDGISSSHGSSCGDVNDESAGMRRTASGMLMPYEETESSTGEGIFGRVIDTVNTARDIAHVIWNVGWRK